MAFRRNARMLDRYSPNVTCLIQIKKRVFIQIARLRDLRILELDVERICIVEILDFHGLNGNRLGISRINLSRSGAGRARWRPQSLAQPVAT